MYTAGALCFSVLVLLNLSGLLVVDTKDGRPIVKWVALNLWTFFAIVVKWITAVVT